jgi:hypothetical protein
LGKRVPCPFFSARPYFASGAFAFGLGAAGALNPGIGAGPLAEVGTSTLGASENIVPGAGAEERRGVVFSFGLENPGAGTSPVACVGVTASGEAENFVLGDVSRFVARDLFGLSAASGLENPGCGTEPGPPKRVPVSVSCGASAELKPGIGADGRGASLTVCS